MKTSVRTVLELVEPEEIPEVISYLSTKMARIMAAKPAGASAPAPPERLMNADEVGQRLGVSKYKAKSMMRSGELPTVRVGRKYVRVKESTLLDWMDRREKDLT